MRILSNSERGASPNIVKLLISKNYVSWTQSSTERKIKPHLLDFFPYSDANYPKKKNPNSDLGTKLQGRVFI